MSLILEKGHCFICHQDFEPNDTHGVQHLFSGLKTIPCNEHCDPQWQKSWDKLQKELNPLHSFLYD